MLRLKGLTHLIKWANISVDLYNLIPMPRHDPNITHNILRLTFFYTTRKPNTNTKLTN
jgi:hypothetical protein